MLIISRKLPTTVEIIAEYAAGQKSAGDPNHIRGVKRAPTIGIHEQIPILFIKLVVTVLRSPAVSNKNTVLAPNRVTFIATETVKLFK
jgi:hypothetical protein